MSLRAARTLTLTLFFSLLLSAYASLELMDSVLVVDLSGVINVAASELVKEGLEEARRINAKAIVLLLNTHGGMLDATFEIIRLIERSSIPIITYVCPAGATAWSAGTFIVLSSHVAAMAPFSIIGSASPRRYPTGEPETDLKVINALVKFLVQRAKVHGRNETMAAKFVTENLNVGAEEAKKHNVVEVVASTVEELLDAADGLEARTIEGKVIVRTKGAALRYFEPSVRVRVLRVISDPMIAYLLFTLGVYGVVFGFLTAGYEGEVIGAILLILGLIGLGFHVDLFTIALLAFGAVLVLAEMREPGFGFLGSAGIACLGIGTLLLLRLDPSRWLISPEWYQALLMTMAAAVAMLTAFSAFVTYKAIKAKRKRPTILQIVGGIGLTLDEIGPGKEGFIRFHGEHWKARSNVIIKPGRKVRIIAMEGLTLIVEPLEEG